MSGCCLFKYVLTISFHTLQVQKSFTFPIQNPSQRKLKELGLLNRVWGQMVLEQTNYRTLRTLYPNVPSYYARAGSWKLKSQREPLHVPSDMFKVTKAKSCWFIRIPVLNGKKIWLPFKVRDDCLLDDVEFCDSLIVERAGRFFLHLVVQKEVPQNHAYSSVLGVDLGERFTATAVLLSGTCKASPKFYGRNIRGIRRKYAYMRKKLGERKLLHQIRRMKNKERRIVSDQLHRISRSIVNEAKVNNAAIVLGDLKGIRRHARGKRFNRIVSNMPYFKLSQYIVYKANWAGVPVVTCSEAYTSKTCHLCHSEGKRLRQGIFHCRGCEHEYNADYNGAFNLAKRFFGYSLKNGAYGFRPESQPSIPELAS